MFTTVAGSNGLEAILAEVIRRDEELESGMVKPLAEEDLLGRWGRGGA